MRSNFSEASPGIDLRSIQVFNAVCRCQSMTEAAVQLSLTQSAVSQQIKHIEVMLGVTLFDRNIRPLKLTPAGLQLRSSAQRIAQELATLRSNLFRIGDAKLPELRIGVVESLGTTLIPPIVRALDKQVDNLVIGSGLSLENTDALLDRRTNIIITSNSLDDRNDLLQIPLLREPYVLVCPATIKTPPKDLQSIAGSLPLIRYSLRTVTGRHIEQQIQRLRLQAPLHLEFDTTDPLMEMVNQGLGWAITTPFCLMQARIETRKLSVFPIRGASFGRLISLVTYQGELGVLPANIARICKQSLTDRLKTTPAILREFRSDIEIFDVA